jgi:hypothetical protein
MVLVIEDRDTRGIGFMVDLRIYSEMSLRMVRESLRAGQNGLPAGQLADAQLMDFVEGDEPRREGKSRAALKAPAVTATREVTPRGPSEADGTKLRLVIDNGRRSAPTPQGLPTPTLRRPLLIVIVGGRHAAIPTTASDRDLPGR